MLLAQLLDVLTLLQYGLIILFIVVDIIIVAVIDMIIVTIVMVHIGHY